MTLNGDKTNYYKASFAYTVVLLFIISIFKTEVILGVYGMSHSWYAFFDWSNKL